MKYKTVNTYRSRPGTCAVCKDSDGPGIDTGRDFGRNARLYVCKRCVREMATALDMPHPDEHAHALADVDELTEKVEALNASVSQLTAQLDAATNPAFEQLLSRVAAVPPRKAGARSARRTPRKAADGPEGGSEA